MTPAQAELEEEKIAYARSRFEDDDYDPNDEGYDELDDEDYDEEDWDDEEDFDDEDFDDEEDFFDDEEEDF
jgi:hypothetical protein